MRVLRFRWGRSRRCCGDGSGTIDEANVEAAPWRWRTGRLIRWDDEIDDESSADAVDEGRQAVAVDDIVGEESLAGRRSAGRPRSVGFRGFWRPRCMNGGRWIGRYGAEDGGGWGFAAGGEGVLAPMEYEWGNRGRGELRGNNVSIWDALV